MLGSIAGVMRRRARSATDQQKKYVTAIFDLNKVSLLDFCVFILLFFHHFLIAFLKLLRFVSLYPLNAALPCPLLSATG